MQSSILTGQILMVLGHQQKLSPSVPSGIPQPLPFHCHGRGWLRVMCMNGGPSCHKPSAKDAHLHGLRDPPKVTPLSHFMN